MRLISITPTAETDADIETLISIMNLLKEILDTDYWTIEDVDLVTGLTFEQIISDLYNSMRNFTAVQTPATNDFGADVVVKSTMDNTGLLIQCKHRENPEKSIGNDGIQEICAAIGYYEQKYFGIKFQPVVVANAKNFTSGAIELAQKNGVKLIARRELEILLSDNKILKC